MGLLDSAIGGITSLITGVMGQNAQENANEANRVQAAEINRQNYENALHFAQNSIQYKVNDATKAGIHPLYALGAPTMSAPAMQVGAPQVAANGLASGMAGLGQNLARAAMANEAPESKVASVVGAQQIASNQLDLDIKKLNLELLKSKVATAMQPATPPGAPFVVPENKKPEERPPLMAGGYRWMTNPDTSPMKAWEDQYGDEGPVAWSMPIGILANDAVYNFRNRFGINPSANAARWQSGMSDILGSGTAAISRAYNWARGQRWVY